MDLRELEAFISQQIEAAETFNNELGEHRAELYDRYMGKPYGDEEPDMSQVVSSDVSDTIEWIMPALMDIFTSTDEVVRFEPTGPEDEDAADQETAVINHIFHNKNNGFLVLHSAFKDALLAKNGIIKWRWEERERVEVIEHDKLTDEDLAQVISDLEERIGEEGEVEIIEQESTQVGMVPDPNVPIDDALMTGSMVPVMEHHIKIRARYTDGEIKVEPVAPEDFIISPRHNSVYVDGAPIVAHGIRTTVGDLLAQGYDYEVVSKLPVFDDDYDDLSNQRSRRHEDDSGIDQDVLAWAGDAMRPVRVYECYVRVDYDGDGLPETRKVLTGGRGSGSILTRDGEPEIEEWQGPPPFANLTPILMSHKFHGRSIAELVEDLARIKTIILRQFLDNIYGTQNPSWELPLQAIGDETINDLMVQRAGGRVIRTEAPGMLREIAPPPLGQSLLAALEYVDTLRENRSGVTRYNQGLDSQSLNKTASGINAILTASQQKIQLIARVFAETGLKALFRGLHQSLRFYARRDLAMKLRNQWVTVDPSHWRERTDLVVNVGLGMGTKDQRIQHLLAILDIQKEGKAAQSPLVNDSKIFNTLEKLVEAAGLKSADTFFVNPDEQGGEPQQPQGDPAVMAMAKAEEAKLAWEQQKFTAEQQFKMAELRLEDDRKRDEFEAETLIKIAEMQGLPITMDDAMAYMSRNRAPRAEQAPAQTVQPQGVVM